jgi:hypothetical protein
MQTPHQKYKLYPTHTKAINPKGWVPYCALAVKLGLVGGVVMSGYNREYNMAVGGASRRIPNNPPDRLNEVVSPVHGDGNL